jgi:hypothetical protein
VRTAFAVNEVVPAVSPVTPTRVPTPPWVPPIVRLLVPVAVKVIWPLELRLAVALRLAVPLMAFNKVWTVSLFAAV